jgi:hypothetical protein
MNRGAEGRALGQVCRISGGTRVRPLPDRGNDRAMRFQANLCGARSLRGGETLTDTGGIAHLNEAMFEVPGVAASVSGTFRLRDAVPDLAGNIVTEGKLAVTCALRSGRMRGSSPPPLDFVIHALAKQFLLRATPLPETRTRDRGKSTTSTSGGPSCCASAVRGTQRPVPAQFFVQHETATRS